MKIAVATKNDGALVSGHAGQATDWLVFDCTPNAPIPEPRRIALTKAQLPHHFQDDGPHPLRGVEVMIAASAGDGFVRHMEKWGAHVVLTGETDPLTALNKILAGETLAGARAGVTTALCKLRDLFSRH